MNYFQHCSNTIFLGEIKVNHAQGAIDEDEENARKHMKFNKKRKKKAMNRSRKGKRKRLES